MFQNPVRIFSGEEVMMQKQPRATAMLVVTIFLTAVTGFAIAGDEPGVLTSIQERLQQLEDKDEIHALLITYGRMLDKEDLVGYSQLFAQDGVWEGGIGSASGPAGIQAMLEKVFGKMTRGQYGNSYHIMSDIEIKVDGDTATSWSRWTWIVEEEKGKPVLQRSGHYEDKLVREDGRWRFKHRLTVTELPTAEKDTESRLFLTDHRDY